MNGYPLRSLSIGNSLLYRRRHHKLLRCLSELGTDYVGLGRGSYELGIRSTGEVVGGFRIRLRCRGGGSQLGLGVNGSGLYRELGPLL